MVMAAGALVFSSCSEDRGTSTETNENDSSTPDNAAGSTNDSTTSYNYETEYRERANRMATQVSQDLTLDTAAQARLRTVFYNRARQMADLETRYSSTNRSAGMTADNGDSRTASSTIPPDNDMAMRENSTRSTSTVGVADSYPAGYYKEMESINSNVDMEMRGFLTPQQYQTFETNRTKYYDADIKYKMENGGKMKIDGDEAKMEIGDTKIKHEGDESKYKSDNLKIKKDGDETKIKTDNTKIKKDGNETKMKSGDTKIKIEN